MPRYDFKYQVSYKNADEVEVKEIVEPGSDRMIELFGAIDTMKMTVKKVSANFENGILGKAKLFPIKRGNNNYKKIQINYEVNDDNVRILDFKPFKLLNYTVTVSHREEGDLLQVDLGKQVFAVTSKTEVANVRYVMNTIQRINNELLSEVENDNDYDDEDNDEMYSSDATDDNNQDEKEEKVKTVLTPSDLFK
ncbi:hypothetical protein [Ligilactobacillus salivarius]|uniref:Uncharacterized protein n=1 Tax=Ligilactobacillus salivarius TaxID=1624 RepID=A0A9X6XJE6_9LACO|nr:hypothetical protein [Ligilactobacillus salivarius]MBE7392643.1 hypothetical protein [Ligilactobacillus salivarius]OTF89859.1 hypothetical protein A8C38_05905 [Ligilactobacillus salivarius]PAY27853.1 hypothetical protein A8C33_05380 [Ligilactobacillus salivarius]PAY29237.1 hypothetical protein A8C44_01940 [Ligilactobacillus salivarius]PAY30018.1 hypothetical protein A8C49_05295 [Ligilactobacillus salivarius]